MSALEGVAVAVALIVAWSSARSLARKARGFAADSARGPQKLHLGPTPRIGGVAVGLGLLAGAASVQVLAGAPGALWLLLACLLPGFLWGLIEDMSKRGAPLARLALTGVSATLGYVLLDARVTETGVALLDRLLAVPEASFCFTVLAVAGFAHAMNIIDGLNGLAGMTAMLGALGLAVVAASAGDAFVFCAAGLLAAAVGGFLLVNYPRGRIFLGDGGAYLVGLLLAELSLLLVQRDPRVSPWFPLLLLAYPVVETLFSVYRRRARGRSPAEADALHLHSLVYRRIVRGGAGDRVLRNSVASLLLWTLPLGCWALAVNFWDQSQALQAAAAGFALLYVALYRRIVRFRVPSWLVLRLHRSPDRVPAVRGQ